MIRLSIIIPSFNTKEMTIKCLGSLGNLGNLGILETEIIVVDNGSKDETAEEIKKIKDIKNIKIIRNKENLGFAKAVNQGLKIAQGKYLLLLNSDTIVENGTIEKMVEYLENNSEVGAVGCQLRNFDGSIQASGGYLPNLINLAFWALFLDDLPVVKAIFPAYHITDHKFFTKEHELGWVTGAFFLTKKEVIDKVGYLDETIFMYVEEIDWCKRVKEKGYKIVFDPEASVIHYKSASGIASKGGILEEFKGLKYYFKKYKPLWQQFLLRIILKTASLGRILLFGIIYKDEEKRKIYEKAFALV